MLDTFGIPLAFGILCFVLLWLLIWARGHWLFKMVLISACFYVTGALWYSLNTLEGWPTQDALPEKFEIKWVSVTEPNKRTGDPGAIFLMAEDIDPKKDCHAPSPYFPLLHGKMKLNEPRIYKMDYSTDLHKEANQIQGQIKQGKKFFASMKGKGGGEGGNGKFGKPGEGQGKGRPGYAQGKGNRQGMGDGMGDFSKEQERMFYELPPPSFPVKDPEIVIPGDVPSPFGPEPRNPFGP